MRMLLLILLMNAQIASAHEALGCEDEALNPAARIVKQIALGLEKRELTQADIEFMIGDPEEVRNPYVNRPRRVENLFLRNKLKSSLARIKSEEIEPVRLALGALIGQHVSREARISDARDATRFIYTQHDLRLQNAYLDFRSNDNPEWQKAADGQLQLISLDSPNALLQIFDLKQKTAIENRRIVNLNPRATYTMHMERGHVITLARFNTTAGLTLQVHDIDKNQNTKLESIPYSTEKVHLVRAKDGTRFLVARTSHGFEIYRIQDDLSLQKFYSHNFQADEKFEVLNSPNGDSLVVAVGRERKDRILIFDPTSKSPAREVRMGMDVLQTHSTLLPDGKYAIAARTTENQRNIGPVRYEFVTSPPSAILQSEIMPESTRAGDWHVTQSGRAIFPVIQLMNSDPNAKIQTFARHLHLFEPLTPTFKPRTGLWARLTKKPDILFPTQSLISYSMIGKPSFYEFSDGRLQVLIAGSMPAADRTKLEKFIKIFEPAVQNRPIQMIPINGDGHIVDVTMVFSEIMRDFLFFVTRATMTAEISAEVYAGSEHTNQILAADRAKLGTPAVGSDGHIYLPLRVGDLTQLKSGFLRLLRLTGGGQEFP